MTAVVLLSIYAGLFFFLVGCVRRIAQYGRAPMHVGWELYPVPHEAPERVAHGGSYFEQSDWWKRPRHKHLTGELRFMLPEMLLLRGLWDFNRKLWYRSFPFHAGLYLMIAAALCSVAGVAAGHFVPLTALFFVARIFAWAGLMLTFLGATSLLWRRATSSELRNYTTVGDLLNVGLFAAACALVLAARITGTMPPLNEFARALLKFDTSVRIPALASIGFIIGAFMAGYVPFTHMGHFIAKYFTYHLVRWDDTPITGNRKMAARFAEYLTYRPTWSAPHIDADGTKTWAEIVTTNPTDAEQVRK